MFVKKYKSIMKEPEEVRNKWALGLTIFLSLFIFVSFGFYRGFFALPGGNQTSVVRVDNRANNVANAQSPLENSKKMFEATFGEISKQYSSMKANVLDVLVPFFTGIDVYERK